jgi:hypothetical protein
VPGDQLDRDDEAHEPGHDDAGANCGVDGARLQLVDRGLEPARSTWI